MSRIFGLLTKWLLFIYLWFNYPYIFPFIYMPSHISLNFPWYLYRDILLYPIQLYTIALSLSWECPVYLYILIFLYTDPIYIELCSIPNNYYSPLVCSDFIGSTYKSNIFIVSVWIWSTRLKLSIIIFSYQIVVKVLFKINFTRCFTVDS